MLESSKFNELANKYGSTIVAEQKAALNKQLKDPSSKLLSSISYKFKAGAEKLLFEFISEDYGINVDKGRKPGKFAPVSKLKAWAKKEGIPERAVFPINRNIFKFGIKPKPWINTPFNKNKQFLQDELFKVYEKEVIKITREEILKK